MQDHDVGDVDVCVKVVLATRRYSLRTDLRQARFAKLAHAPGAILDLQLSTTDNRQPPRDTIEVHCLATSTDRKHG